MTRKFKRIYLQVKDDDGNNIDATSGEMTWCRDRINDSDVEYVLASDAKAELEAVKHESRIALQFLEDWELSDFPAAIDDESRQGSYHMTVAGLRRVLSTAEKANANNS